MSSVSHIAPDDAAGLAALAASDPERERAYVHARGCTECAAHLADGEALIRALAALREPVPPSEAALQRAIAPVLAALDAPTPNRAIPRAWPALMVTLGWLTVLALERHRAHETLAWIESAGILALAVATTFAVRAPGAAIPAAIVASAACALWFGGRDALAPLLGLKCVASELVAASVPLGAVAWLAIRRGAAVHAGTYAGIAAAGALAGQSVLHVACPSHAAEMHLVAFHTGGVIVAALVGAMVNRLPPLRALARE